MIRVEVDTAPQITADEAPTWSEIRALGALPIRQIASEHTDGNTHRHNPNEKSNRRVFSTADRIIKPDGKNRRRNRNESTFPRY
jgi:hypothetical protein